MHYLRGKVMISTRVKVHVIIKIRFSTRVKVMFRVMVKLRLRLRTRFMFIVRVRKMENFTSSHCLTAPMQRTTMSQHSAKAR